MAVRIVFLGKLADLAGGAEQELPAPLDWMALVEACEGDLGDALSGDSVRVAVNGELLADKASLSAGEGDEVALLPPVSGG
ncbi:MAG: MoaD/ThiS family protein [Sphingomonadaceae bacterium]|nr:MoaD/ThiS family protein [Sphingomonadaceae bacterium]